MKYRLYIYTVGGRGGGGGGRTSDITYNYTSTMLSIFGRAGAILLAVVDASHALFA